MIKFNNNATTFGEAFNISDAEEAKVQFFLDFFRSTNNVSRSVERVWIDETINDNVRALSIFSLGRMYERTRHRRPPRQRKGGEYGGN